MVEVVAGAVVDTSLCGRCCSGRGGRPVVGVLVDATAGVVVDTGQDGDRCCG